MAMSLIWTLLVALSLFYSVLNGRGAEVSAAALEGARSGITLALSIAGPICLWNGLNEVMSRSGISARLAKILSPLLKRLYPVSSKNPEIMQAISANVSANFLGLGNAATPLGIKATRLMKEKSGSSFATDEMCLLIIINTASIELIPTTVASLRAAAGAASPFDIMPAVWLTSICSVCAGITAAFLFKRCWKA